MLRASVDSPKLAVLGLVRGGWTADNVGGVTPEFRTGWYQETLSRPHITATDYNEDPVGGGITGLMGVRGDGSGGVQQRIGFVNLNCWAHRDMTGLGSLNPKTMVEKMMRETMRILIANIDGTDQLSWISPGVGRELPPLIDKDPVVFQAQVVTRYGYFLSESAV